MECACQRYRRSQTHQKKTFVVINIQQKVKWWSLRIRRLYGQNLSTEQQLAILKKEDPKAVQQAANPNRANLPNSGLTTAKHGGDRRSEQSANLPTEISNQDAAEKFNVSERLIKTGKQVLNNGIPELNHRVETGHLRISTAADIATLPPGQQDVIVDIIISAVTTSLSTSSFRQSRHRCRHHHFGRASTSSRKIWPWQGSGSHQQTRFLPFSSGRLAISSGSANRSALYRRNASVLV